jgi:hypothetical protein
MITTKKEIRKSNGYRLLLMPEHNRAMKGNNWDGYVYEHVVVAEKFLGREMKDDEVVHHLDGNRANNRIENLLVLQRGQHNKFHAWLDAGAPSVKALGKQGVNSGKAKVTEPTYCDSCGRTLQRKQKQFCSSSCSALGRRETVRPSRSQLRDDMKNLSWLAMGRKYDVSDNAVRKWARAYGLLSQS